MKQTNYVSLLSSGSICNVFYIYCIYSYFLLITMKDLQIFSIVYNHIVQDNFNANSRHNCL